MVLGIRAVELKYPLKLIVFTMLKKRAERLFFCA